MKKGTRRRSILLAHGDPAWIDKARSRLENLGYDVTACPEPSWTADLITEDSSYDLAAISSEIDPAAQAKIIQAIRRHRRPPRLMILLDNLDTASVMFRSDETILTHRISEDVESFVRAVVERVGLPPPPH